MKRITLILTATAAGIGLASSLAGAAPASPSTSPVPYAPGSLYVYASSGKQVGTLTGSGLGTQLGTTNGLLSK